MWGLAGGRAKESLALSLAAVFALAAAPAASARAHAPHAGARGHHPAHSSARVSRKLKQAPPTGTDSSSSCSQPLVSQSFLSSGDFNYYAALPGPLEMGFDGTAWSLSGGARVVSTQLADGTNGSVLDLPAGSQAVSPDICISPADKPALRAYARSLNGGDNVQVSVSFYTSGGWTNPQGAGDLKGQDTAWTASNPQNVPNPPGGPDGGSQTTWQIARFILTPGGGHSEFNVYGLSVSALPPTPDTGPCSNPPVLSQTFLSAGDPNYYTQAPDFSTWTLTGGAQVKNATLPGGTSGPVLDLPAGSMAVSPNICVTSLYPTARMMIRSLFGGDDLSFRVSYANTNTWTNPHETGHVHGNLSNWSLSDSVQLQPGNGSGWQIVRLTLVPNGGHSEFQIYDLQLDPYAKG